MNRLLPSFTCLLMTLEVWIMSDENARLNIFVSWQRRRVGGRAPGKVKNVALEILPGIAQIFCDIELLVNFARLVICKVLA